jgi:hypothetical protein
MKYYKKLQFPNSDIIIQRLREFLSHGQLDEKRPGFRSSGIASMVRNQLPELWDVLAQHGIKPHDCHYVALITTKFGQTHIHQDDINAAPTNPFDFDFPGVSEVAMNWPILNCENGYTACYQLKQDVILDWKSINSKETGDQDLGYVTCQPDQVIEMDRIAYVDQPILLRIDQPHNVVNLDSTKIRFTVSMRFSKDVEATLKKMLEN